MIWFVVGCFGIVFLLVGFRLVIVWFLVWLSVVCCMVLIIYFDCCLFVVCVGVCC